MIFYPYSTAEGGNKGIDIAGVRERLSCGGKRVVVLACRESLRGYGTTAIKLHNEGYITVYAHNDTMLVNNGQSVKAGKNRYDGQHGCRIRKTTLPDSLPGDGHRSAALFAAAGE